MRFTGTVGVGVAIVLAGCVAVSQVAASAQEEVREVGAFDTVVVRGDYTLAVNAGERDDAAPLVMLSGAAKDVARIVTEVRGDTLFVEKRRGRDPGRVDVVIDVADGLRGLTVAGAVVGEVRGLEGEDLDMLLSGSVKLDAAGTCGSADVDVSGSVSLDARDLVCETVALDIAGAGDVAINAQEELAISIAGSGRVDVYGDPARVIPHRISGAAVIDRK